MIAVPHFLHGSEASGGKSPGMKTFASQPGHVTIFRVSLMYYCGVNLALRTNPTTDFS
jgi:hypothetical protein